MWLWHNTHLISDKELIFSTTNRAFQYGDGIFETVIIKNGVIQHAEYHEERISRSIKIMKLNFILSFDEIMTRISFLLQKNDLTNARAKIVIWRQSGGLYTPTTNDTEYIIITDKLKSTSFAPQHLDISNEIKVPKGVTQNCKTLNALPYVLAGLELKERNNIDDLILLNVDNHICECISSNIFWVKDDTVFTPSLKTNCVAGVKRQFVIDKLKEKKIPIIEVENQIESIYSADFIFKTNVTGVYPVKSIGSYTFKDGLPHNFL